jgi:hypothetical protein
VKIDFIWGFVWAAGRLTAQNGGFRPGQPAGRQFPSTTSHEALAAAAPVPYYALRAGVPLVFSIFFFQILLQQTSLAVPGRPASLGIHSSTQLAKNLG